MRIVNGKRYSNKDIEKAIYLKCDGWNSYDGQNWQWYSLFYNPKCGLVILKANNSGSCFGDYEDRYFSAPEEFKEWASERELSIGKLLGDIDEDNSFLMDFVNKLYPEKGASTQITPLHHTQKSYSV